MLYWVVCGYVILLYQSVALEAAAVAVREAEAKAQAAAAAEAAKQQVSTVKTDLYIPMNEILMLCVPPC